MKNKGLPRFWIVACIAGLLMILVLAVPHLQTAYRTRFTCSVFDVGTGGGKALALWAEKMGWNVTPLKVPLLDAVQDGLAGEGHCVLTAGNNSFATDAAGKNEEQGPSLTAFRPWIAKGNTLVIMTSDPASIPESFFKDVLKVSRPACKGSSAPEKALSFLRSQIEPEKMLNLRYSPQIQMRVRASNPRWLGSPSQWETLGDGDGGTVYHRIPIGKGSVVVILDDYCFTNSGLDDGDNPRVLADILTRAVPGRGVLYTDEYRHGYRDTPSFSEILMRLPGAKTFLLLGCGWLIMYLLSRNVRFSPPAMEQNLERRSAFEYVEALAGLHQRARSAPLLMKAVSARLLRASRRRGSSSPDVESLLQRSAALAARQPRSPVPSEEARLVGEMIRIRKERYEPQRRSRRD